MISEANVAEAVDSPSHEATSEEAKTAGISEFCHMIIFADDKIIYEAVEPKLDFTENPVSSFVAPTEGTLARVSVYMTIKKIPYSTLGPKSFEV